MIIALENFITWKMTIDMAFRKYTIPKEKSPKLMKIIVILTVILIGVNIGLDYASYRMDLIKIDNLEEKYIKLYNTDKLNDNETKILNEARNKVTTNYYSITLCKDIATVFIYLGTLPYVKKRIEDVV
jgi:hypothetical protein